MTQPPDSDAAGSLVRPYALVGGRTRPRLDIALEMLLVSNPVGGQSPNRRGEYSSAHMQLLSLCARAPVALAEIAALSRLPIGVTRILASDLIGAGLMQVAGRTARQDLSGDATPLLLRVRDGLRRL